MLFCSYENNHFLNTFEIKCCKMITKIKPWIGAEINTNIIACAKLSRFHWL